VSSKQTDKKKIRILIINLHSSRNAGDAALTRMAIQQLRECFPNPSIALAMNDPDSCNDSKVMGSFMTWFKKNEEKLASWRQWRWLTAPWLMMEGLLAVVGYRLLGRPVFLLTPSHRKDLLRAYFEANLIISCAGNFLYTSGKLGLPFLISIFTIAYAWMAGKPLYTMPQTIGPLKRRWERALVKWIVQKMRMVFVRDPITLEELKSIGVNHPYCYLMPDIAFAFPSAPRSEGEKLLAEYGIDVERDRPLLGLTLLNWGAQNRLFYGQDAYEEAIAEAIRTFIVEYGGHAILFSQVQGPTEAEDDRIPARRVQARLYDLDKRITLIERAVRPEVLKATYGLMDIFIGTRLHSNILALSEGVPVIAIEYQYKTRGVMRMLGLERWVVDIQKVNGTTLVTILKEVWSERECIQERLLRIIPGIIKKAMQIGEMIAADFAALKGTIR
jgi:colanic acid/amylovoran biosynthesis protein